MKRLEFLHESYDPDQLAIGTEIEYEHTNDRAKAEQIAKDHLDEYPDYYTGYQFWKVECEEEVPLPPLCDPDSVEGGNLLPWGYEWREGSRMFKRVKLVRRIL